MHHTLLLFCFRFFGVEEEGERKCQSSHDALFCFHLLYVKPNKIGTNPDKVVASLKNRKQTKKGDPTDMLDHLHNTQSVAQRDPNLD
jgi:hypothetical protein